MGGAVAGTKGTHESVMHSPGRLATQWWGVAAPESTPERPIGRVVPLIPKGRPYDITLGSQATVLQAVAWGCGIRAAI
jgi:hypothetical protein